MHGPDKLFESEDCWHTNMGAWFPEHGRVVLRGRDLLRDFEDIPWMGLLLYAITGRIHNSSQVRLFEGMWALCTSYPEPRLWNNRVAALAGTTRSTAALGVGAATAVSEASIYGGRAEIRAMDFLCRIQRQLDHGADLIGLVNLELEKYRIVPGYGRPITRNDERIEPLMALVERLGFSSGLYVTLAFRIEQALAKGRRRLQMNIAALAAAIAADQGMSTGEYYRYVVLAFSIGITACYIDACDKPGATLFPLRCSRIRYLGNGPRRWNDVEHD